MKIRSIIYKFKNTINGKIYIGQTINEERRIREHKNGRNCDYMPIDAAINKYGFENFVYSVLWERTIEECDIESLKIELNSKEIFYIEHFNCRTPNGYNILKGGNNMIGIDNPMYGKPISDLHRQRLIESHKGIPNSMRGKHYSAEQKDEIVKKWKETMAKKYDNGYIRKTKVIVAYKIFNKNIKYLGIFPNVKEAERNIGIDYKCIHYALKKQLPLYDSFIFMYKDQCFCELFKIISRKSINKKNRFVKQLDLNGNIISILPLSEATKLFGHHISECCSGKRNSCKGYKFEWVTDN